MKLPGVTFEELGKMQKKDKDRRFTAEDERRLALSMLGTVEVSGLTQKERGRVLRRALKVNEA